MRKRHKIQEKILELAATRSLDGLSLRQIAKEIRENIEQPQKIRHHLMQLQKKGLINFDKDKKVIRKTIGGKAEKSGLVSVPILGLANCGPAAIFADQSIQGYLKMSKQFLPRATKSIFAIKAVGSSLNRANINGDSIEDGDYVLIDSNYPNPRNKDYVLSVIDDVANIKRFIKEKDKIILLSESTDDISPIYIHPTQDKYMINGKVVQVVKKPKIE